MTYRQHLAPRHAVAQTPLLSGQEANLAADWTQPVDEWARLDRFLTLGDENGLYSAGAPPLTSDCAPALARCLAEDGARVVRRVVEVSAAGRAPRNEPALFALAMATAAADDATRQAALAAVPRVARTGGQLLTFAATVDGLRGWGRGLRRAVANWFTHQDIERLAVQAIKSGSRLGWALRDLLRLAHPLTDAAERRALFDWIAHPDNPEAIQAARAAAPVIDGVYEARAATSAAEVAQAVLTFRLPHEATPSAWQSHPAVLEALLTQTPVAAMLRALGPMSASELLTPGSEAARVVIARLGDDERLRRGRVQPLALLLALKSYVRGCDPARGLNWTPVPAVVEAVEQAFERSLGAVEPVRRPLLAAVAVSDSLRAPCVGSPVLTGLEAAAALVMQFARSEPWLEAATFGAQAHPTPIAASQSLDAVVGLLTPTGGTTADGDVDCAAPLLFASQNRRRYDGIVILTGAESQAGAERLALALADYRRRVNRGVKLVTLAPTANPGALAGGSDPLSLGVCGFDAATPRLIADFLRGGAVV